MVRRARGALPSVSAGSYSARVTEGAPRPHIVRRVMAVWGFGAGRSHSTLIRWMPPESFLEGEASIAYSVLGFAGERFRAHLPSGDAVDLAALSAIGEPGGPSDEVALRMLRLSRRTLLETEAAYCVLDAPGPVPARVSVEAAYLLASNRDFEAAMDALAGRQRRRPWKEAEPPAQRPPRPPRSHAGAEAVRRELEFREKTRAFFHESLVASPTLPPPVDIEAPRAPSVGDVEIERILLFGKPGGPTAEEVVATLGAARGTGDGVRAIRNTLAARALLNAPLPEPVRALVAEMLAETGDRERALAVLADVPPSEPPPPVPPGIDVDTDLTERDAPRRAAEAERVIAEDVARLGVAERHGRFRAVARAARLTLDMFRSLGGRGKREAIRDAAGELERAGEHARAGEMYALGGDQGEVSRVGVPEKTPPSEISAGEEAAAVLGEIDALDKRGLRLAALAAARAYLGDHDDAEVAAFARGVSARLARVPTVTMAVDDREARVVLADAITIGRVGATIELRSPLVSRLHVRLRRRDGVAVVEDLGSHNGTFIAGARLAAPLPIGDGIGLAIGGEIPCSIQPAPGVLAGAFAIDVSGERWLAPLGPLSVAGFMIALERHGEESVIALHPAEGGTATLGGLPIETAIELSRGDVVAIERGPEPPVTLRIAG